MVCALAMPACISIIDAIGESHCVIDVNGVGYEVQASSRTLRNLKLGEAAHIVRTEEFVASPGPGCSYCAYKSACPAKIQGEQVLP